MTTLEKHEAKRIYKRLTKKLLGPLRMRVAAFLFIRLPALRKSCCPLYVGMRIAQHHPDVVRLSVLP